MRADICFIIRNIWAWYFYSSSSNL